MPSFTLALDRATRYFDADGRLHVPVNQITKAAVNPYYGREIPNAAALGLDAKKVYQLFRDPAELEAAAATSNNIQLMGLHVAVSADEPQKEFIAGTLGSDAAFSHPYVTNSLCIWDAGEIAAVESEDKREISMGYRYDADMTPGVFEGVKFDGIMRNIRFNHAALVEQGRAGPDVMVGDSKLEDDLPMPSPLTSRKALMLQGALSGTLIPLLAKDAKIDLNPICQGVTADNFAAMVPTVRKRIEKATTDKLATDAKLDGVYLALDAMKDCKVEGEDEDPDAEDEFPPKKPDDDKAMKEKKAADEKAAKDAAIAAAAKDGAIDEAPPGVTVAAMDSAIASAVAKATALATAQATANFTLLRQAEADVRPIVGELPMGMDSAAAIYRFALDAKDVDLSDIPADASPSILRAMVKMIPDEAAIIRQPLAMDSAARKSYAERYPGAARVKQL